MSHNTTHTSWHNLSSSFNPILRTWVSLEQSPKMWDFPSQKTSYPPVNQPHKRRTRRSPGRNASTASENEVMKHSIRGPGPTPSWDWYGFMGFPWKLCISPVFIHRQPEQHDIEWIIGWNLSPSPHTSRGSKVAPENGRAPWGNASSNTKGARWSQRAVDPIPTDHGSVTQPHVCLCLLWFFGLYCNSLPTALSTVCHYHSVHTLQPWPDSISGERWRAVK